MRDHVYDRNTLAKLSTWISKHKLTNDNIIVNGEDTNWYNEIILAKLVFSLL